VPLDTTLSSVYFTNLIRTGAFNQFVLEYANQNRERLMKEFSSAGQYISNFEVDKEFEQALIDYATAVDVGFDQEGFNTSKKAIDIRLKALLGRNLYDSGVFYQVINDLNSNLQRAIRSLQDGTFEKANLAYKDF